MGLKRQIDKFIWAILFGKGGSGSGQAHLNPPTITRSESVITITNPATNGNFCDGYDLYCNGTKVHHTTGTTIDLEELQNLPTGVDEFTVRCVGSGMLDSADSNIVAYLVENYFYTDDDELFETADDEDFITA